MSQFTFTADAGTDQITTSAPHGLVTGGGPGALRNIGGALPAATPSLATLTDYWFVVVDTTHLKIATSQANALNGITVDITGTGTGTHYLELGIPYRRATTYAPLSQVKSADLNSLEDAHTALADARAAGSVTIADGLKRSSRVRHIPAMTGLQVDAGTAMTRDATHDYFVTTAATNVFRIPIALEQGERLTQVQCRVTDAGTDVLTMKIWRSDLSGSSASRTQLGSNAASTGAAGTLETLTVGSLTEVVGTQFYQYFAEFTCTFSSGCNISGLYVTTDVPGAA